MSMNILGLLVSFSDARNGFGYAQMPREGRKSVHDGDSLGFWDTLPLCVCRCFAEIGRVEDVPE